MDDNVGSPEEENDAGKSTALDYDPLSNDLILKNIFEYLRPNDLRTCRGVCKAWNVSTIPFIQSKFKVIILGRNRMKDFIKVFKCNEFGIPLSTYVLTSFNTQNSIGRQFLQLAGVTAKNIVLHNRKIGPHCLDGYGATLTTANLTNVFCRGRRGKAGTVFVEDIRELLKSTPNLESLELPWRLDARQGFVPLCVCRHCARRCLELPCRRYTHHLLRQRVNLFPDGTIKPRLPFLRKVTVLHPFHEGRRKYCPTFFEELLSAAPNISELDIAEDTSEENAEVMSTIGNLGMESAIESLTLRGAKAQTIESILTLAMKPNGLMLKKLHIVREWKRSMHFEELQLVTIFKDTLEYLDLDCYYCGSDLSKLIRFPRMPKLKTFKFNVSIYYFSSWIGRLNEKLPILQKLELRNRYLIELFIWPFHHFSDELCFLLSNTESCPTVKSFQVFGIGDLSTKNLNCILTAFPKLTKFTTSIDGSSGVENLKELWTRITKLEFLSISISSPIGTVENLGSSFTEIPTHAFQKIDHFLESLDKRTTEFCEEINLRRRIRHPKLRPIGYINDYRTLDLCVYTTGTGNEMANLTGHFALYSMKHYKYHEWKHALNYFQTTIEGSLKFFEILKNTISEIKH